MNPEHLVEIDNDGNVVLMTTPPSREPGQAPVTDALTRPLAAGEAEQIQDHAEHHTAFWQDTLRLLADRTQREERIAELERELRTALDWPRDA